jgi:hypothetical protein
MFTSQVLPDTLRLRVDFNDVAPGHRLRGSLRFASSPRRPEVGQVVRLWDGEGNECWAVVSEIRNLIVFLTPRWETWTSSSGSMAPTSFSRRYTTEAPRTSASLVEDSAVLA